MTEELILGIFLGVVISVTSAFAYFLYRGIYERDEQEKRREMEQYIHQMFREHIKNNHKEV